GARLLDPASPEPLAARRVLVEDDRIVAVGPPGPSRLSPRLDLGGLWLLPGLINAHVHLCLTGAADPVGVLAAEPVALTTVRMVEHARVTVEAGVTTVRDLGGRDHAELAVREAVRQGLVPGPRIVAAGKVICMTGGHGH